MATSDPAFNIIPKSSTFFIIWRIENMKVVPISKEQYSSFHTGDAYIVACGTEYGEKGDSAMKTRIVNGGLEIHIHFWIGAQCSKDEQGVAAIKTVELDDYFGGYPVQHREVEGHESKRFVSYFKKGLKVLEGGVASGFRKVDTSIEPCLFHIKGKRKPIIRQTRGIGWEYLNDGDVFVLDAGEVIFVWTGKYANNMEKIQGARTAQQLKADHGSGSVVIVEDGKEKSLPKEEKQVFEQWFPLKNKKVKNYKEIPHDDEVDCKQRKNVKLYRCSDEGSKVELTQVKLGPLEQSDLNSQDSFIVDNGEAGIWVWVGRKASPEERKKALEFAQGFIVKNNYPNYTQITRVIDGGETTEFKSLFKFWRDVNQTTGLGKTHNVGKIAKTVQTKFDASTLHENTHLAAKEQMVDDGTGDKKVYRVENFDLYAIEEKDYGKFYSGDCYVVVYRYNEGSRERCLIYYWLGLKSSSDERGTAALKTVELDDQMNGEAVQIRTVQGKEPPQFMAMFGGKMIILEGGHSSGFRNTEDNETPADENCLLHVRGTSEYNTKAVQVEKRAASLNSGDVFVLLTDKCAYIWAGKGSTGDEREMAKKIASQSGKEQVLVSEGQEKSDFWGAIGGQEPYSNTKLLKSEDDCHQPRLYQCSNASGRFQVEEIFDFNQSDLIEDDIMLLDAWDTVFLWIGNKANSEEKKMAMSLAEEYLNTDPSGRDITTSIMKIKQGFEPPNFTGFFGVWDRSLWNNNKTYEEIKAELAEDNPGIVLSKPQLNGNFESPDVEKYPLEVLLTKVPEELPEGVDPTAKENHLTDEDFLEAFGIPFNDFQGLPKWKQVEMKKRVGLF
ncbi:villin-1-like isoform X2 [Tachypleus tridentatus]